MRSIESEGDSIDQAIEKALQTLQVGRDQVEVEILADVTRGLFGFGGKKARIRATVRAPLGSRLGRNDGPAAPDDSRETDAPPFSPKPAGSREAPSAAPIDGRANEGFQTRCKGLLLELLSHLGISGTVEVRPGEEPGSVVLDVTGDSGGLLIGRRGQTLDAIEYTVNRMAARDDEAAAGRVTVDVERYRERRREYLAGLAHRLADKVKHTGRVVTLNPMSPRDRRIVHLALQGDTAVATRSQGDGHFRKLLIVPAERSRRGVRQTRPAG